MTEYSLYLESGPRQRRTMIHALDLLGCIAQGPTTPEALEAAPDAIRAYLRFLRQNGEDADPQAPFTTRVAAHVMEGSWIANGDPTPGFAPDFHPLRENDLEVYCRRLDGLHAGLLRLTAGLSVQALQAEPERGRTLLHILEHTAESEITYLRYQVGPVAGLNEAMSAVRENPTGLPVALSHLWHLTSTRWASLSDAERTRHVQHGQVTWTARRGMRRALEHNWEHLLEISARLDRPLD